MELVIQVQILDVAFGISLYMNLFLSTYSYG